MADTKARSKRAPRRDAAREAGPGAGAEPDAKGHVCPVAFCPIGLALSAVQGAAPDALEHLLAAAREFLLAARAVVDARADDVGRTPGPRSLERIEIA